LAKSLIGPAPCLYLYAGVADVHVKKLVASTAYARFILSSGQKALQLFAGTCGLFHEEEL
jgi:hypothetical protein